MRALKAIGRAILWTMAVVGALFVGLMVLAVTLSDDEDPQAGAEIVEKPSAVEKIEARPKPPEEPKPKARPVLTLAQAQREAKIGFDRYVIEHDLRTSDGKRARALGVPANHYAWAFSSGTQAVVGDHYYMRLRANNDAYLVVVHKHSDGVRAIVNCREAVENACVQVPSEDLLVTRQTLLDRFVRITTPLPHFDAIERCRQLNQSDLTQSQCIGHLQIVPGQAKNPDGTHPPNSLVQHY